uniref:Uncharacterized protein n=1 Tax=Cacopsylla melanoneura TaxID=428564 RepID=A0A8D8R0F2_9HEMI
MPTMWNILHLQQFLHAKVSLIVACALMFTIALCGTFYIYKQFLHVKVSLIVAIHDSSNKAKKKKTTIFFFFFTVTTLVFFSVSFKFIICPNNQFTNNASTSRHAYIYIT